jgi:hypothetical protein
VNANNIFLGEIKALKDAYERLDLDFINNFIEKIIKSDQVYFKHPLLDGVNTQVRSNIILKEVNVVFLSDERNQNRWCFIQSTNFIDALVIGEELHILHSAAFAAKIKPVINDAIILLHSEEVYSGGNKKFGGFVLQHKRPFHFIYDFLRNVHFFHEKLIKFRKKVIPYGGEFIPLKEVYGFDDFQAEDEFYFFISSLQAFKSKALTSHNVNMMEKLILSKVKPDKNTPPSDLIVWVGVTGQKRFWIEQIDGYASIINSLCLHYNKVLVYVDGMTSYHNESCVYDEDTQVCNEIKSKLTGNASIVSLIGQDYFSKISLCQNVDFFISNGGSGSIVPHRICNKPGVMHSSKDFWTFGHKTSGNALCVAKSDIKDLSLHSKLSSPLRSYFIDWRFIFNLLMAVSPEKLAAFSSYSSIQSHESLDKYHREIFRFLISDINTISTNAELLELVSKRFEAIESFDTAISLLEVAQILNPKKKLLTRKIKQFQRLI